MMNSSGVGSLARKFVFGVIRVKGVKGVGCFRDLQVILNGDSPAPTRVIDDVLQPVAPTTAEQRLARKNELKVRGTLLMALPDKYQLKFNTHKDAKTLMEAIEKRFGGKTETKKRTHTLIWRNKTDLEEQSLDDLFNSLKIYEAEVKSSSSASTTTQNIAFLSSSNTSITNEPVSAVARVSAVSAKIPVSVLPNVDSLSITVIYSFFASQSNSPQLDNDDLKTKMNLRANGPTSMGFDMSKVECYNYHMKGHFVRECRSPKDTRMNGAAEPQRRSVPIETSTSIAFFSQCDGVGSYDWSFQVDEEPTNYALMAFTSSSSSFDNEARLLVYQQKESVFKEDIKLLKHEVQLRDNALVVLRQNLKKAEQEMDDLKHKLEKFQTSSKNLSKLLASQTNDKTSLSYNSQVFTRAMFDCDDYLTSGSDESLPPNPIYDSYQSGNGYHVVPPPYTGTFMPPKPDLVFNNAPTDVESDHPAFNVKPSPTKPDNALSHIHRPLGPIIEDWVSDSEDEYETKPSQNVPTVVPKSKFVTINAARPITAAVPKINVTRPRQDKPIITKPNSLHRRHINCSPSPKASTFPPKVTTGKVLQVNAAKGVQGKWEWKPKCPILDYVSCNTSASMTLKRFDYNDALRRSKSNTDEDVAFDEKEPEFKGRKPESEVNVSPSSSAHAAGPSNAAVSLTRGKFSYVDYSQLLDDANMPELEDFTYSDDEDDVDQGGLSQINNDDVHTCMFACFLSQEEPKRIHQALKDTGTKWVFRNKKDERGIVVRNKARLVTQGHTQDEGIDYKEVFTPVARIEAIRLFLAYASFMGFMVYQMDVKSAFLYVTIKEEVYVCEPPGFEDPDYPDKVYKVVKALYSLHQAPRAWYETLANYLLENGFQRGKIDQILFIKSQKGDILLVQIYVDDIIFGSTNKDLCKAFQKKKDGIFISQDKYVAEILRKFGVTEEKSASTPIDTEKPLLKDPNGEDVDVQTYRPMIGSLMYLTSSRPDIMFAFCACAHFQVKPKASYLHAVKRIFRYLKDKPHLGLWYLKDSPFNLVAYSDSDYVGASLDRKSTTGGCQFLGCRLIYWQYKKQTVVATSSTEAELTMQVALSGMEYLKRMFHVTNILSAGSLTTPQMVNNITRLQALVEKKRVIITEATTRDALRLDDAEGIECLPNEEILSELARIGYEKPSTKLTFYKAFFPIQLNLVRNVDSLTKFYMYPCFLQLIVRAQVGDLSSHTIKYSSHALTQKVFANIRRVGKGCSGVETSLFERVILEQHVGEGADEVDDEGVPTAGVAAEGNVSAADDVFPTAVDEPSPLPPTQPPPPSQDIPSTSQGRMIDDMNADVDVTLKDVVAIAKDGQYAEMEENDKVEPAELKQVVEVVTTAKLITEVVTGVSATITIAAPQLTTIAAPTLITAPSAARRRKSVVIRDPKETATPSTIIHFEAKSKDKGKGILKEDNAVKRYQTLKRKPQTEAQAKKNMMIYLRNVAGFKMDYFKRMTYDYIRLICEKYFNSNVAFLLKTKKQVDEEDNRVLKRLSKSQDDKTAKSRSLMKRYSSSNLEKSKKCSWSSEGQELEAVRVLWCADYHIYYNIVDFVGREEISTYKVHSESTDQ
nr:hypothetical protein [Tanacetum cinerariifolium]